MQSYLRVKSVSKRLDMSESTVWQLVQQGILPKPIKLTPRTIVWCASKIDAAVKKQRSMRELKLWRLKNLTNMFWVF
jgi:predicted DNA-binding transcriptional regulator AlpA